MCAFSTLEEHVPFTPRSCNFAWVGQCISWVSKETNRSPSIYTAEFLLRKGALNSSTVLIYQLNVGSSSSFWCNNSSIWTTMTKRYQWILEFGSQKCSERNLIANWIVGSMLKCIATFIWRRYICNGWYGKCFIIILQISWRTCSSKWSLYNNKLWWIRIWIFPCHMQLMIIMSSRHSPLWFFPPGKVVSKWYA